jgi:HEAT repeat protein
MAWMDDDDAEVRRHTLKILGRVCATEAAESFLKKNKKELGLDYCTHKISRGLNDPDPEVRKAAVEALAHLNDEASKQALEETLPEMDKDMQELARAALRSMQAK